MLIEQLSDWCVAVVARHVELVSSSRSATLASGLVAEQISLVVLDGDQTVKELFVLFRGSADVIDDNRLSFTAREQLGEVHQTQMDAHFQFPFENKKQQKS
ncbi:MAG: hypothetical protein PHQ58_04265 [Rhodoferax sp.]|uniref:hypothetical protein n=1 Tax=Rhodoferax sp. TaxID=50421 RepID=UPI0026286BAA|nr:hypothetical protein [Rhodoferax sp.]MDD2879629.1 hypothetical protein [Rhodoferax sp.]